MAGIVEYMEEKRRRDAFLSMLKYLLKTERIEPGTAPAGITKQIIGEGTLDKLSPRQLYRYEHDISRLIKIGCDGHCAGEINIEDLENAYMREIELGGVYCQHCMYDIENQD